MDMQGHTKLIHYIKYGNMLKFAVDPQIPEPA